MTRRQRHETLIGQKKHERRKAVFDRRRHGGFYRFVYGVTLLPLGRILNAVSAGRIPVRGGEN